MTSNISRRSVLIAAAATTVVPSSALLADGHGDATVVEMLNKHPDDSKQRMVFYPRVLKVKAGETVTFKSVDKGHNSETIKGMVPDGAEGWKSKINDDLDITFDKPGIYGFKCTPHTSLGMVGLVVVEGEGMLDNMEEAKGVKHRGKAKKAFEDIWEEAEAAGYFEAPEA